MQLLLIHGAPATGKSTIVKALATLTGVPHVDSLAAIDIARMVFGSAKPGFWGLVHDIRVTTLRGAAKAGLPHLITTAAYNHPDDEPLLQDYMRAVEAHGGAVKPIHLSCSEETLMERVSAESRVQRGQISTPDALKPYLDRNNFVAIPGDTCVSLSTETATPEETAIAIAQHFKISVAALN